MLISFVHNCLPVTLTNKNSLSSSSSNACPRTFIYSLNLTLISSVTLNERFLLPLPITVIISESNCSTFKLRASEHLRPTVRFNVTNKVSLALVNSNLRAFAVRTLIACSNALYSCSSKYSCFCSTFSVERRCTVSHGLVLSR